MSNNKKEKLESKVLKLNKGLFSKDEKGRYLPFCNYEWHTGIIKDETYCQTYNCVHYQKFYVNNTS